MKALSKIASAVVALALTTSVGFAGGFGTGGGNNGGGFASNNFGAMASFKTMFEGQTQAMGFGDGNKAVRSISGTDESYLVTGDANVTVDPNCNLGCGDQRMVIGIDTMQNAWNSTFAKSEGTGKVQSAAGSAAQGVFEFKGLAEFSASPHAGQ